MLCEWFCQNYCISSYGKKLCCTKQLAKTKIRFLGSGNHNYQQRRRFMKDKHIRVVFVMLRMTP